MTEYVQYPLKISYEIRALEAETPIKFAAAWGQEPAESTEISTPKLMEFAINGTSASTEPDEPIDVVRDVADTDARSSGELYLKETYGSLQVEGAASSDEIVLLGTSGTTEADDPIDVVWDFTGSGGYVRETDGDSAPEPIVGGSSTGQGQFPFQVGLQIGDEPIVEHWDMIA